MRACLGIDTSCYTTSAALCGLDGDFMHGERRPLEVSTGERGLKQSDALFQHVKQLPELLNTLFAAHPETELIAVCASVTPRPAEGSYMPVFRAGEGFGRAIAAASHIPFLHTTHQQGHVRAAMVGTPLSPDTPFVGVHLSGGTTESVLVTGGGITVLGGTEDLHAGQLIDRVGVAMSLPFPAGPALELLAGQAVSTSRFPTAMNGLRCSFSGAEAQAMRMLRGGTTLYTGIAAEVFSVVARTAVRLILASCESTGVRDVLMFGGVASSTVIGRMVRDRLTKKNATLRLHIARKDLSADNAIGVALEGCDALRGMGS
ncbi:MAG: O-sialoglycoprotein endopeptidase [Clostridia bacterium]|nr:O-sialoglycoprotein endopeptidase [Clostridia bacterium]